MEAFLEAQVGVMYDQMAQEYSKEVIVKQYCWFKKVDFHEIGEIKMTDRHIP